MHGKYGVSLPQMVNKATLNPAKAMRIDKEYGSIEQGKKAVIVGLISVFVFMFIYYLGAGFNATLAQVLNLYIMFSVLSALNLTLTLPSIAGFVLTIGMAVDANVVIFERIKEELREGKGRKASIEAGFNKAFWAVMDSNITTILAALFLSQLGTGPIQGFAVCLAIGNITSLFTSLFVSRLVFDFQTDMFKKTTMSIGWRVK
jgi:preprotein translocase subunit SecD